EVMQPGELKIAVGTAGPTDDDEAGGGVALEIGQRPHGDVGALEALDAADEEKHGAVAQPEYGARRGAGTGRERAVVDAGSNDLDALRRSRVQPLELCPLLARRGEDDVGAPDHLGLGLGPLLGLL